jgi:hypothetical protein
MLSEIFYGRTLGGGFPMNAYTTTAARLVAHDSGFAVAKGNQYESYPECVRASLRKT